MRLSIVISTYNGEKYLLEQLKSIMNQNRKADEVLIFDDISSDNTVQIAKKFIEDNELLNWKLRINNTNKGWRKNFIEGMWEASGDIILPCDQDDVWLPNKLEEIEHIFEINSKIQLLTSNCIEFYDDGYENVRPQPENGQIIFQPVQKKFFETIYPGCTYAIRKELVNLSKEYWEENFPHDALIWRMAIYSETAYSYNKSLIRWRKHRESAYTIESAKSKTFKSKRAWLEYAERALNSMILFINNNDIPNPNSKKKILNKNLKWIKLRKNFYDTCNPIIGIVLVLYLKEYPRKRQLFGDWYLVGKKLFNK